MQLLTTTLVAILATSSHATAALAQSPADAEPPAQPPSQAAFEDRVLASLTVHAGGLTADEAADKAGASSPAVAAAHEEVALTRARNEQIALRYLPRVSVAAGLTRSNATNFDFGSSGASVGALNAGPLQVGLCPDGSSTNCVLDSAGMPVAAVAPQPFAIPRNSYKVETNLAVPLSDYLFSWPGAKHAADADANSAVRRTDAERANSQLQARIIYYQWLRGIAQIAVAEQALSGTRARLDDAKLALASGTVAGADVLQIESAVATAEIAVANSKSAEALLRANLAILMGVDGKSFTVGENLLAPIESLASHGSLQELIAHGHRYRAEVAAFRDTLDANAQASRSARAELYPRLDGVANLTYANPNQQFFPPERAWNSSWYLGLSASWGFDRHMAGRNQIKQLSSYRRIAKAQHAALRRGIALEITNAWQQWHRAEAALGLLDTARQAAEAAYKQRVTLYRAGEATTVEIVEAELQRHNATLLDIDARVALRIARAQLLRAAAHSSSGTSPGKNAPAAAKATP